MKKSIIQILKDELESEAATTRKMLSIIPNDKYDWQPHPKSMTVRTLSSHIAELPGWILMAVTTDELDFAQGDYQPSQVNSTSEVLEIFEKNLADGRKGLDMVTDEILDQPWTMRSGDTIYATMSKYETIRHAYFQTIHHRAQLGVFMRLLNVPIPGTYGPSADDMSF